MFIFIHHRPILALFILGISRCSRCNEIYSDSSAYLFRRLVVMAKSIAAAESVKALSTQNTVPKGLIPSCTTDSTMINGIAIASKKDPKTSFFVEIFFITTYFIGLWVSHDSFPALNVKRFIFSRFPFFNEGSPACAFLSRNWKKLEDGLPAFFSIRYFLKAVHKNEQKSPPYCLLEKYLLLWISIDLLPERLWY